ncbi:hypothetical protein OIU84_014626 [Salix udensis]|uniref:Endonuclease/exonuclease/phosphatase domain-containing protein n=1 Tax=Salix udensis TaxID=889485 RepID=A0AAD6JCI4_9ROSI|nr:hypothetical protein OIU84_014626 [Salix udensis]
MSVENGLNMENWQFLSNEDDRAVVRILIGWDPKECNVQCIHEDQQWVTCDFWFIQCKVNITITFVYGMHTPADRRSLWDYIVDQSYHVGHKDWLLMGDFNATLRAADSVGGDSTWAGHKKDFGQCLDQAQLHSMPYKGLKFTWDNGRDKQNMILKKLDWVIGNDAITMHWPNLKASFLPRSASDHSAIVVNLKDSPKPKLPAQFKFLTLWTEQEDFLPLISTAWGMQVRGTAMFQLITKLKIVKARLQQWHRCHRSDIKGRVAQAQVQWEKAQAHLDKNLSEEARRTEREAATFLRKLLKDEESFYKQKSRIQWLMLGDRNTAFFHRSMQHRYSRNRITNLTDGDGNVLHDQEEIGAEAVKYFKSILAK